MKIHSLKYNFLMNLVLSASGILFPLVTFPLASRALGADMYGLCTWASSVTSWVSMIAMLGAGRYGIREVARSRDDSSKLSSVTYGILYVTLVTTAFSLALFFASFLFVDKFSNNRTLLLINSISVVCNTLGLAWFFKV